MSQRPSDAPPGKRSIDPARLRESLLALILKLGALMGLVVYVPSVFVPLREGQYVIVAIDTAAVCIVVALYRLDRMAYRWRAAAVSFICYALAIGLTITVGAISQVYLVGFSIIVVLLFGRRAGLGAAMLSSLSLFALGIAHHAAPDFSIPGFRSDLAEWFVICINFALVNTVVTLAVGTVLAAVSTALEASRRDLDARKHVEADGARMLAELQLQIKVMPLAYLLTDRDLRYTRWNRAAERLFGYREAEVLGKEAFASSIAPGAASAAADVLDRIQKGTFDTHVEVEHRTKDGQTVVCEWHNTPILDEDGAFAGLLALGEDVTSRKRLEEQLRQAQKMDAVGRLAGGVAHDFNNLLTVVLSYSDLLLDPDSGLPGPLREDIEEIRQAGLRAAELTRRLLMFSRQQVVQPQVFELNDLMASMGKMLQRLLGEDVELVTLPGASRSRVRADPGSIEQVLVNLVVNARDAMPVGGVLTLETTNIALDADFATTHLGTTPGDYVMFSVTDTGCGMDKTTLARVFEPFFTTKERGKGTGLGLSTVFGIVEQSGGTVWVYSELGLGTTFKVYLPQVDVAADRLVAAASRSAPGGSETILLVEDEDAVRGVTANILRRSGYAVLEARNAAEALDIFEQHREVIQLLLTDVVMPGMSGPELAKRLVPLRPHMKVLCMSGYTDDAVVRHGFLDAGFAFVQKPVTIATLTRAARDALDAVTA